MINGLDELVRTALADPRIEAVLRHGDWYLLGSRAMTAEDDLSDWDTVVLTSEDVDHDVPADVLDEAFAVTRPRLASPPSLELHIRWRRSQAIELRALGPSGRASRERDLAEWAFQLRHAVPLRLAADVGEPYRAQVEARFDRDRHRLAQRAYEEFRTCRNQAVATLPRSDQAAEALTAALCVRHAAQFWLLAAGEPHPGAKWLLHTLERHPGAGEVLAAMRTAVDLRHEPEQRFDALWTLWRLVDHHADTHGIDKAVLAGSPFRRL
ncbi:hypothetical protein [Actinopolymorpha pittospori]|uniref:Nucleotidyltransferase n=1 Tax=Actinopolymorpha pittospori TaxID=648752 RepID=A0A927RDX2_9ACTN|nr:hypothetical protein [Actinopolymorpha pittospori]MBE1611524.1 putative nucleotidyltransferase [Actinopolymorpha pittospori]